MIKAGDFSERDWKLAPTYTSPIDVPMGLVLDFRELSELAREEETIGAFRRSEDGTLAKAPLYIDNLPAAFYRVATGDTDFTPNHNTSEQETIVVMEGVLRIVLNTGGYERTDPENQLGTVRTGQVIELADEAISMQAVGFELSANCLALALYLDHEGVDLRLQ